MQHQLYAISSVLGLTGMASSVSLEPAQSVFAVKLAVIIQNFFKKGFSSTILFYFWNNDEKL